MEDAEARYRRKQVLAEIGEALHDVCQPLTALQCRLEIAQMGLELPVGDTMTPAGSSLIWAECLRECGRLNASVETMRSIVRKARADDQEDHG